MTAAARATPDPAGQAPRPPGPEGCVDHPSGFLALSPRNTRFELAGVPGFIAYRRQGRHRLVVGGVHAPAPCRARLLDEFLRHGAAARETVVALQVREDQAALFADRGFRVGPLGTSYAIDLARFTFAGTRRMKLRNRIKRARDAGVEVVELGRDRPWTREIGRDIEALSRAWLGSKGGVGLDLLVGELGDPGDPGAGDNGRRVFAAFGPRDRLLAFITYVPAWGARPGVLHDLTRRLPDAPAGVMELVNAVALSRFQDEGVPFLHFGLTPFIVDRPRPGDHRALALLVRLIGRWGGALYPARSQAQYKLKWGPDVVEPELIAFQRISLGAIWALLVATRAVVPPWRRALAAPAPPRAPDGGSP
jgi:lysylphosphatidylglycerol synthetase-like protein (DUF2156 family)